MEGDKASPDVNSFHRLYQRGVGGGGSGGVLLLLDGSHLVSGELRIYFDASSFAHLHRSNETRMIYGAHPAAFGGDLRGR